MRSPPDRDEAPAAPAAPSTTSERQAQPPAMLRDPEPARATDARRVEILRAALDLFSVSGFHGTSVRQIARAVGVNEATLYHYFPSKDAILTEVVQHMLAAHRARIATGVPKLATPVAAEPRAQAAQIGALLRSLGEVMLRDADDPFERKLTRLLLSEGPRLTAEGRIAFEDMLRTSTAPVLNSLRAYEAAGGRLGMDAERLVLSFIAPLALWHLMNAMSDKPSDQEEGRRLVEHQTQLITAAMAAAPL